ncbi:MAG: methionyl-tRNA formyltransferase [Candidatus Doudnabacteria bacterium]|nr:methionyl-tRNA formyltransferase [Candidatus Doudnabacteria bacterium]
MRIVFIGTTEFGIPTLEKLKTNHELVLIITQPDKLAGRKRELTPPPVKVWAQKNNIQVLQSENIANLKGLIEEAKPDLIIVAAYGQIIPKEILDIPKFKSINIHGSILPKYRGASPIQATIINLEPMAGITLIQMDEKMDHGPMIAKASILLDGTETFSDLYKKLAVIAADLVIKTLPDWFEGKIKPIVQDHDRATFAKMIKRSDAKIDWSTPAKQIDAMIRALNPEPGTWTMLDGKTVKILKSSIINDHKIELPGKIYFYDGKLAVKTLDNSLIIEQIQPEGKSVMSGKDFLNGLKSGNKLFI